ncbi:MAG: C39 family peptidase [Pseudomonadota bacterium]
MKLLVIGSLVFFYFQSSSLAKAAGQVPYFSQYDNVYEPDATCGLTSAAMVISYFKARKVSPDSLYQRYGKAKGATPEGQTAIYKDFGLYATGTRTGSRSSIINHLKQNRIVVIHGWFTENGHIMPLIQNTNDGFVANDPAGVWKKCARCGYTSNTLGAGVKYTYADLTNSVLSYDGDIWYSVISNQPF